MSTTTQKKSRLGMPRLRVAMAATVCVLNACAFAPGMTYQAPAGRDANARVSVAATGSGGLDGVQNVSSEDLIEITPAFVEQQHAARSAGVDAEIRQLFGTPKAYVIGPGDVLNIVVWDHPELNLPTAQATNGDNIGTNSVVAGYTVDAGGNVQFAQAGLVHVAGLTEAEARAAVTRRLGEYVRKPQIVLRIQAYRSKRVYLDGEVRTPGLQIVNDMPMTLPEAIDRAGGFTAGADRSQVTVTRGGKTVNVSLPAMIAAGINPSNILLRDGDLVRVRPTSEAKVFVLGEVSRPATLTLTDGRISLGEALGETGGVSQYTSDARQIYVVRRGPGNRPQVYHLDGRAPASYALADQFPLERRDVVFVDASSLVRWSRVVNLLIPSAAQGALTARAVTP
ncbi:MULTISPECIES: polysaccharide biosynthesis/export family protein [Burkholderia cepacia complex]|uniref:polysaccharide biosynthesis/export family protein n=1 Tax=Burkholderia cepacia complex TaxID=87882 RepID=UPI000982E902|nr:MULTISPECIES: polysaccharide biosynthesis/export family protein [Burkholderia cepacia complex]AQQ24555.1 sugar transporter [Burkholderia cenocepacia]AQT52651.1 sugar transporter [Burkholderia cenocepacia]MBK1819418.1 polysaccharide biosynthesis/export family protein [Burkholderia orbicola]MDN7774210.1 polysaccharide biosynthesis/export family protein [Burkholderia orbicola]ONV82394.1 sugar transporter [Burkholderia cenocepacia]